MMRTYQNICITNRHLVQGDFLSQMNFICGLDREHTLAPDLIILREKDLTEEEYESMAKAVITICEEASVTCILHTYKEAARRLGAANIHLPMKEFLTLTGEEKAYFEMIGVSTHTVEEAVLAEKLGATYITASHIFATDCKKGLEPRGLSYLGEVIRRVKIPVYALGGIHPDNLKLCVEKGASGICMMSEYMKMEGI